MKKIGILGSGTGAKALAKGFLNHGYEVMLGTRDAAKLADFQKENKVMVGSFAQTAAFGNLIVLATKGKFAAESLKLADFANLEGKTIIDTTNPIEDAPPENGVLKFFTSLDDSLMEQLQKLVPKAHFVKAFNCVGNRFMVDPDFNGQKPTMFICGNSEDAKNDVKIILNLFGWETEDMGKAEAARAIEPLCILWCLPGFLNNQWSHAFKLLKK